MRFFCTPSGLTIDRVRSSAITTSLQCDPCGTARARVAGMGGKRSLGRATSPHLGAQVYPPAGPAAMRRTSGSPRLERNFRLRLDGEAFAAAAFALDVGILEAKRLVQALLDEIDHGAVDVLQALGVDDHLDATVLEHDVLLTDLLGVVHDVGEAGAAGLLDSESQADAL